MVECICAYCGSVTLKTTSEYNRTIKRGGRFFCNHECHGKSKITGRMKACTKCGELFWVKPYQEKQHNYCSRKCMDSDNSYILRKEQHYRWRDDVTSRPYYRGKNWITIKKQVRERDNHICKICGITELQLGKKLDVHHIKPYRLFNNDEEANALENLISLCPSCHHRVDAQYRN